jgi:hypothetical protein
VRQVEQLLVVGVGVDRRHPPLPDAEALVEHFRHRREAVRRARGVGDDLVLRRIVVAVVDAHEEGHVGLLRRRGDDHALRAGRQVLGGCVPLGEESRGLEHDLHAEVLPRELRRILRRQDLELFLSDGDAVSARLHVDVEVPEHGVVLEQVRQRGRIGEVVDRNEVDVVAAQRRAHDVAPNPPEPVDPDLHRHRSSDATVHASRYEAKLRF